MEDEGTLDVRHVSDEREITMTNSGEKNEVEVVSANISLYGARIVPEDAHQRQILKALDFQNEQPTAKGEDGSCREREREEEMERKWKAEREKTTEQERLVQWMKTEPPGKQHRKERNEEPGSQSNHLWMDDGDDETRKRKRVKVKVKVEREMDLEEQQTVECPVCRKQVGSDIAEAHVNRCLSRVNRAKSDGEGQRSIIPPGEFDASSDISSGDGCDAGSELAEQTAVDANEKEFVNESTKSASSLRADRMIDDSNEAVYRTRLVSFLSSELEWRQKGHQASSTAMTSNGIRDEEGVTKTLDAEFQSLNEDSSVSELLQRMKSMINLRTLNETSSSSQEWLDQYKVVQSIYSKLYEHQKAGLRWLCKLKRQGGGGILGDEQGLGKTCQVAVFLGMLKLKHLLAPAKTSLKQEPVPSTPSPRKRPELSQQIRKTAFKKPTRKVKKAHAFDPFKNGQKLSAKNVRARLQKFPIIARKKPTTSLAKRPQSRRKNRVFLVVCPTTTLSLWLRELRAWAPWLRVLVLHHTSASTVSSGTPKQLLQKKLNAKADVLVTTYGTLRSEEMQAVLLRRKVGKASRGMAGIVDYVVFDEGHKLKNPLTGISEVARLMSCSQKLIVTGTPLQNGLHELWTLFDIVKPGLLGTYSMFERKFEKIIKQGGAKNASKPMVYMAYKCAMILKETIRPYLLRRIKKELMDQEVARDRDMTEFKSLKLPKKSEYVLFCHLTDVQVRLYEEYITSSEVEAFLSKTIQKSLHSTSKKSTVCFRYIKAVQHICNHPILFYESQDRRLQKTIAAHKMIRKRHAPKTKRQPTFDIMNVNKLVKQCGKLRVLDVLLRKWKGRKEGTGADKVLLFSQSRSLLNILENYCRDRSFSYLRMDGTTAVRDRNELIETFNTKPDVFLFLLTTRVGGVGINLTGANKVVIFDPDWNPTTDAQARERAYRLGQQRDVEVYRLITQGTIEEKIYNRQIYKQHLTNKVLVDPRKSQLLKQRAKHSGGMKDLFTLTGYEVPTNGGDVSSESLKMELVDELRQEQPKTTTSQTLDRNTQDGLKDAFNNIVDLKKMQTFDHSSPEDLIMKEEATKVAKKALQALQASAVSSPSITTSANSEFKGASSSALLQLIRSRD